LTGQFDQPVEMWKGIPQAYYVDEFADDGVLFEGIGVTADLTALSLPTYGDEHAEFMNNIGRMASVGLMVSDEPIGRVSTKFGLLWISYRLTEPIVARLKKSLVEGARMMLAAGATKVHFAVSNLAPVNSMQELERLDLSSVKASHIHWGAFHPLGTCRIGPTAADSVVDSTGRVHGQERVFVCDGSVLPASTQVNPQLAIMAVASRVASQFCS
jgi:choline dehydrogenase-like flavoprotein